MAKRKPVRKSPAPKARKRRAETEAKPAKTGVARGAKAEAPAKRPARKAAPKPVGAEKAKPAEVVASVEVAPQRYPDREKFVVEFLKDGNATQAAIRAGYSPKTAYSSGQRLLKSVEVADKIAKAKAAQLKRLEISADRVLNEIARVAYSDLSDVVTWEGPDEEDPWGTPVDEDGRRRPPPMLARQKVKPSKSLDKDVTAAIAEISESCDQSGKVTTKVKMHDKLGALKLLGQHLKLFADKLELSGPDGGPIEVANMTPEQRKERLAELLAKRGK